MYLYATITQNICVIKIVQILYDSRNTGLAVIFSE